MNWQTEQSNRFQVLLNNCNVEMTDEQLTETMQDFEAWEDENSEMNQDTFNERLKIRLS